MISDTDSIARSMAMWRARRLLLALGAVLAALVIWASAGSGAASAPGCPTFDSQAAAQVYFDERGGTPRHRVGRLDPDHDGVACEDLGPPYQGFATIGYNRKHKFFYGVATMPPLPEGNGFACLSGNKFEPDGPRRLRIYRVKRDGDVAVLGTSTRGAEARPKSGRLVWKADKATIRPGRYYVSFEASVRVKAYGPNPCPELRSAAVVLP